MPRRKTRSKTSQPAVNFPLENHTEAKALHTPTSRVEPNLNAMAQGIQAWFDSFNPLPDVKTGADNGAP